MRHSLIRVHTRVELQANANGFKLPLNCVCTIFVVFVNRGCLFIFHIYIGIRIKVGEISGICLLQLLELRVWLTRARSAGNPFEPP